MSKLADQAEDIGVALVITALVVGGIAVPMFLNVSTTGMTAMQLLTWGSLLSMALIAIALSYIRSVRSKK